MNGSDEPKEGTQAKGADEFGTLEENAAAVVELILDEPWFTYQVDHDDGIERSELQLALCSLARVTPLGHVHFEGDGCLEYCEREEELDELAAKASAAQSPMEECRRSGHEFLNLHELRDTCVRCPCIRIRRGNPGRFVYEYPGDGAALSAPSEA